MVYLVWKESLVMYCNSTIHLELYFCLKIYICVIATSMDNVCIFIIIILILLACADESVHCLEGCLLHFKCQ